MQKSDERIKIWNVEFQRAIDWTGNWNMEFCGPKKGLGMELEYGKFHAELYSHSGIQGGFLVLVIKVKLIL